MKLKTKKKDKHTPLTTEEALKKLGKRIKQLRIQKGYTSYEYFAYDHDMVPSTIWKI